VLSRFQIAKAKRADVLIIVHPKSGGTWLRVMLFRLYQEKYHFSSRRVFKTDELYRQSPRLPKFLITNGHYSYEGAVKKAWPSLRREVEAGHKKVLFVARHPCDIVVSWYLQFTKRTKAYKRELINRTLKNPVNREAIEMWEFVMHPEIGLPGLIDYFNTWHQYLSGLKNVLLVRYEDLRSNPHETLRRITDFMGKSFSPEVIKEAVEFASMENLRKLEKANYFQNAGLSLRNANDPDTLKVRRGKVGGYRDYFTPEQVAQLDSLVQNRLDPIFGYGKATADERERESVVEAGT